MRLPRNTALGRRGRLLSQKLASNLLAVHLPRMHTHRTGAEPQGADDNERFAVVDIHLWQIK